MSKIDRIYVATHRRDLRWTRICIASIRYFYPETPISLLVDEFSGACDVREICQAWNTGVLHGPVSRYGFGFSKLEPLFVQGNERFLVLDSDTVFAGPVLDVLGGLTEDLVVPREDYSDEQLNTLFVDQSALRALDPRLPSLAFAFNTGQWVGRSGLLSRADFARWLEFSAPRKMRHPDVFLFGEQGLLNFVVNQKVSAGALTVKRVPFMRWPGCGLGDIELEQLKRGVNSPYPIIIHWAGMKRTYLHQIERFDILKHFEDQYYQRLGNSRRYARIAEDFLDRGVRRLRRALRLG